MKIKFLKYSFLFFSLIILIFLAYSYSPESTDIVDIYEKHKLPNSKFINVNGINTHYDITGEGENLVLLHGFMSELHSFDLVRDSLSQHFRVISVDFLGHGLTDADPNLDYSVENNNLFLESFLAQLGIEKTHILGHSLGAYWALNYTHNNPQKVDKVILLNGYGGICPETDYTFKKQKEYKFLASITKYFFPKFLININMGHAMYQKPSKEIVDRTYDLLKAPQVRIHWMYAFQFEKNRLLYDVSTIKNEKLLLYGDKDIMHTPCEALEFAERLTNDTLIFLKNVGHISTYEDPQTVSTEIISFLEK